VISLKIQLTNLISHKRLFLLIFASSITLILLLNVIKPLYAAEYGNNNSKSIISLDNLLSFNWIPDFKIPSVNIKNPYEESEENFRNSGRRI